MRLRRLIAEVPEIDLRTTGPDGDPALVGVVQHSAQVEAGVLFCCVRGRTVDGHDHASTAVSDGAVALLVDHRLEVEVPQVLTPDVRAALGPVAAAFWGQPSRALTVIGVTGTNGKTTVVHLLEAIADRAGWSGETIGTLSAQRASGVPTTPEATELQAELADLRAKGTKLVAVEVSSHALEAGRVDGTQFAVGIFTNLSADHLDHHGDLDRYFAAKARLFDPGRCRHAVIGVDGDRGRHLASVLEARSDIEVHTFSLSDAGDLTSRREGTRFTWRGEEVDLPLQGEFNVLNALAAATAAAAVGIPVADIAAGLSEVGPVRGRFELVDAGQDFTVIVDYAHTPDSLRAALEAAAAIAEGSVRVVFGCGGDRDATKRPLMGAIAERLADEVVVTSDNPRSESPDAIIDAVVAGMTDPSVAVVEPDRRRAIAGEIRRARRGDVLLIAGKGHETEQITGDRHLAFDDREVVLAELSRLIGDSS